MSKVIIIGRNYTSRIGMIRAVGSQGHDVYVINSNKGKEKKEIDSYSKYVKKYLFAPEPNQSLLIKIIISEKLTGEKVIILPVDDYAASTIDQNIDLLKHDFLFPNINMEQGAVTRLMDKGKQKHIAEICGLNVAQGWIVEVSDGHYLIPENIIFPCFPKPQISFAGDKQCMKRCNNRQELEHNVSVMASRFPNCSLLVEQYVRIEHEYATLGFSDGINVVLPGMIEMIRDGSGPHKGVTLLGRIKPVRGYEDFLARLKDFIRETHFVGLFDIDSYYFDGKFFFNELNLRFGASGYAVTSCNVNLPDMFLRHLTNKSCSEDLLIRKEAVFVNEKVVMEDVENGYLSSLSAKKIIKSADITFINNQEDHEPFVHFNAQSKIKPKAIVKYLLRCLRLL